MTYSKEQFKWLTKDSIAFLNNGYLVDGVDAKERIKEIANAAEEILEVKGFSDKFYNYMANGWYSLSSPVWANFGTDRGLPISCFGSYVDDSVSGITFTNAEVAIMSKLGGGTSGYFGAVRPRGSKIKDNGKSNGSYSFLKMFDSTINVISQGSTRRGRFSPYIDIEHPDIEEWLEIGSEGNQIQDLYFGVCVSDKWLQEMKDGDDDKRTIWAKVLQHRTEFGHPYIFFTDNMNNGKPDVYKDNNMPIYASNLCTEIALPSSSEESFVCCLSSMNLALYEEWKDTDAVETLTYFLDAVMQEFINKLELYRGSSDLDNNITFQFMERAYNFAVRHRALGLGVAGLHTLYQSKMIPFDSFEAMQLNAEVFKLLKERTEKASKEMAKLYGVPELLEGYGRRNTTLIAIAPTVSSSTILGRISQGVEPILSNYFVDDKAKLKLTYQNPHLKELLKKKGKNTKEVWRDILQHSGSVQHLDFLTDKEKDVFKTFAEISQMSIIKQAAQRQKYIDQAQSINLVIHPDTPVREVNALLLEANTLGVKSLYYQKSVNAAQELNRNLMTCTACQ